MRDINLKHVYITLSLTAVGLVLGSIVSFLKLPIYLDTLGIMLTTLLLGWRYGVLCSALTAAIGFFVVSPYLPFYFPVMLGVVFVTEWTYRRNIYGTLPKTIVSGIIHGTIATAIAAPTTYFLFHGFTSSGNDVIVALFYSKGMSLLIAVLISHFVFTTIDRVITAIFASSIGKALPLSFFHRNGLRPKKQ
jgi:energy-coupling factor transport system substrate-specific component